MKIEVDHETLDAIVVYHLKEDYASLYHSLSRDEIPNQIKENVEAMGCIEGVLSRYMTPNAYKEWRKMYE